jgi:hypothetical protein
MYNFDRLTAEGISFEDASALRRISMTLHRWYEMECGDTNNWSSWSVVRGNKTGGVFEYNDDGKPYIERHIHTASKPTYTLIADRERGANKRLARIMAKYPQLGAYLQTDPRGCALYIGKGLTDTNYNQGIAVYQ